MITTSDPSYDLVHHRQHQLIKDIHFNQKDDLERFAQLKSPHSLSPTGVICEYSRLGRWVDLRTQVPGWWDTQYAYVIENDDDRFLQKVKELRATNLTEIDLTLPQAVKDHFEIVDRFATFLDTHGEETMIDLHDPDELIIQLIHEFELYAGDFNLDEGMYEDYIGYDDGGEIESSEAPAYPRWEGNLMHSRHTRLKGAEVECPYGKRCYTCNGGSLSYPYHAISIPGPIK